ncbi:MAG TPA: hypothetical protein VGG29_05815 [Caulobacteraceae bacterium]|jgi:hypothetical protein
MTRLQMILTAAYWLFAAAVLWLGYEGDAEIDRLSLTPVTHSAAFDAAGGLGLAAIVYVVAAAIWWGVSRLVRSPSAPRP